jgi:3-methyl-2-oxobutanoate hydroxymethyltransferase
MTRITVRDIQKMRDAGERIAVLTAYDAISAKVSEAAGVPLLLVGDTLGMVVQGRDSTIPVTLDQMIYHCEIVVRVTQRPFVIGDLPFMTYSISPEQAMNSAARLVQESGVHCVKLEGGEFVAPTIRRLTQAGIPVMAHIGLTPQSVNQFGGYRVQGREIVSARQLMRDALAVQDAGAFAVVLELVPAPLARLITERLRIPTIGIGAGVDCSGQVQVFHDILTLFDAFTPRHARRYANLSELMTQAIVQYVADVMNGGFPTESNSFAMDDAVIEALRAELDSEDDHADR